MHLPIRVMWDRGLALLALALLAIAWASCAGHGSQGSTASVNPAAPSASTMAVAVSGSPASSSTFQLTAMARLSDGTSRDVTSEARWESTNADLATVSSAGLVTVQGTGDVEFRATYQGVTGSMRLFVARPVPPATFTLSGIVHEAGTMHVLSGARLLVSAGPDAGTFAVSDQGGLFTFPHLSPGVISLEGSKDGYYVARLANLTVAQNMTIDFTLSLLPPRDANGATATGRCSDGTWTWEQTWAEACTSHGGTAYPVCPGPLCN